MIDRNWWLNRDPGCNKSQPHSWIHAKALVYHSGIVASFKFISCLSISGCISFAQFPKEMKLDPFDGFFNRISMSSSLFSYEKY